MDAKKTENAGKIASVAQEERIAKLFRGKRTPQSGGGKWVCGDILAGKLLIECKTTVEPKLTYSVQKAVLDKANHEAREMGKESAVLAFTIGENFEDYFVVDTKFIKSYLELQDGVNTLLINSKAMMSQIEAKAADMTQSQKAGRYEVTELDKTSFQIHKSRLNYFIEELEKLV